MITFTLPARVGTHLSILVVAASFASPAWSRDYNKDFDAYLRRSGETYADAALRSRYDAEGAVLTYEAYADLRSDVASASAEGVGPGAETFASGVDRKPNVMGFYPRIVAAMPQLQQQRIYGWDGTTTSGDPDRHVGGLTSGQMAAVGRYGFQSPAIFGRFADVSKPMPSVHIVVSPNPPPDYAVSINGRSYPATVKSLYIVSGTISIVVTRSGRQPCLWSGTPTPDKVQEITCPL